MPTSRILRFLAGSSFVFALAAAPALKAWNEEGHRMVNEVALASLPADFPAFVRDPATAKRIAWLSSEPDRWRSTPDLPATHQNAIDHYIDLEQLDEAGLTTAELPSFRYDFAAQFSAARAAHLANFPPIDPKKDRDHTRPWCGFLPWAIEEGFGRLRGDFSRLKVYEEFGMEADAALTRASIVEQMGVLGHYVGDGSQPLHTTIHHNGWVGANPHGYTTWDRIHAWIDGGFILKANITFADLRDQVKPATALAVPSISSPGPERDPVFALVMDYLLAQHAQMEPLYQLEKAGGLNHDDRPASPDGKAFIERQLLVGGQMLGQLWYTAWKTAAPDNYLRSSLLKKNAAPVAK
ncbi:MAG TPA: hypothetical protein VHD32_01560 [Candidatus Didemnitutus sp.]|nr:hypothetical protein [Candidatus Didemnitutus sp.]